MVNDGDAIGTSGIDALTDSGYLTELRVLELRTNPIGNAGIRELAQWRGLLKLIELPDQRHRGEGTSRFAIPSAQFAHPNQWQSHFAGIDHRH